MKSKIIYFVLYLVVIAELLVVIHERDLAIESIELDKIVQTAIQKLNVSTQQPENNYTPHFKEPLPATFSTNAPNPISPAEKKSVQFFAKIDQSSQSEFGANYFPEELSSVSPDESKKAFLKKDGNECNLTVKVSFLELPGNVKGKLTGKGYADLIYHIYTKSPRILDNQIAFRNIIRLFERLLQPTEKDRGFLKAEYVIEKKDEQDKKFKTIAARLFLGMEGEQLATYVSKVGVNPEFGISENAVNEIVTKANEVLEKASGIKDSTQKTKAFDEFKSVVYKHFKGKQDLGLGSEDDFYHETSYKTPIRIRIALFN
ncbi:MAG: hypothetical protein AB9882_11550 [Ignavibacteriaceae bacterium]